jgi:hypothetical protein
MDEDSNTTVLMADNITLKTLLPNWTANFKKMVLDRCRKRIMGST